MMLMIGLDETNKKLNTSIICKNVLKYFVVVAVACIAWLMGCLPSCAQNLFVVVWVMDILQREVPRNAILLPC